MLPPITRAPLPHRGRCGFALPASLFALTVIAALVAGSFVLARQEERSGRGSLSAHRGLVAADDALTRLVASLTPPPLIALTLAERLVLGGSDSASVTRLNANTFYVEAIGVDRHGGRRWLGRVARIVPPPRVVDRPLSIAGALDVSAPVTLEGGGAGCFDTQPVSFPSGFASPSYEPTDPWSTRATKRLAASIAVVTPAPVSSSRGCVETDPRNWGDPSQITANCGLYFPVIFVPGDLVIEGGVGQGVLVVNGDLTVRGGFEFKGLVLVRGRLRSEGTGASFAGGVQVESLTGLPSQVDGPTRFAFSPCAIATATLVAGTVGSLPGRGWIQVYK